MLMQNYGVTNKEHYGMLRKPVGHEDLVDGLNE